MEGLRGLRTALLHCGADGGRATGGLGLCMQDFLGQASLASFTRQFLQVPSLRCYVCTCLGLGISIFSVMQHCRNPAAWWGFERNDIQEAFSIRTSPMSNTAQLVGQLCFGAARYVQQKNALVN